MPENNNALIPVVTGSRKYFLENFQPIVADDLIKLQKDSFQWFLEEGLKDLFDLIIH